MKFKELLKVIKQKQTMVICYKNEDVYATKSDSFDEELLESEIDYITPDYESDLVVVMKN